MNSEEKMQESGLSLNENHKFVEFDYDQGSSLDLYSLKILDEHLECINKLQNSFVFTFKDFRNNVDKLLIETAGKLSRDFITNGIFNDKVLFLQILRHLREIDSDSKIEISVNPLNYGLVKSILPEIHNILKPFQELEIICDENLTVNNFKIESDNSLIDEDLVGQVKKINNILSYSNLPEPDLSQLFLFNNDEFIIDKVKSLKYLNGFELIKEIDPSIISNILQHEHPQTVALILSKINHLKSFEILNYFPKDLKLDIESRITSTNKTSKNMVDEVESVIYRLFNEELFETYDNNDGLNYLSNIILDSDEQEAKLLFESIEEFNPDLAKKLKEDEKVNISIIER
jgi:hypothetical protein